MACPRPGFSSASGRTSTPGPPEDRGRHSAQLGPRQGGSPCDTWGLRAKPPPQARSVPARRAAGGHSDNPAAAELRGRPCPRPPALRRLGFLEAAGPAERALVSAVYLAPPKHGEAAVRRGDAEGRTLGPWFSRGCVEPEKARPTREDGSEVPWARTDLRRVGVVQFRLHKERSSARGVR